MSPKGIAIVVEQWYCQTSRLTIRLVALVQQGSGAANSMVEWPTYRRCKVTYVIRCLVISSFVKSYPVLLNHIQFLLNHIQVL
jgi:hypothetical protein